MYDTYFLLRPYQVISENENLYYLLFIIIELEADLHFRELR